MRAFNEEMSLIVVRIAQRSQLTSSNLFWYREGRLSVSAIGERLHISKSTLYSYLRHRGVDPKQFNSDGSTTRYGDKGEYWMILKGY